MTKNKEFDEMLEEEFKEIDNFLDDSKKLEEINKPKYIYLYKGMKIKLKGNEKIYTIKREPAYGWIDVFETEKQFREENIIKIIEIKKPIAINLDESKINNSGIKLQAFRCPKCNRKIWVKNEKGYLENIFCNNCRTLSKSK